MFRSRPVAKTTAEGGKTRGWPVHYYPPGLYRPYLILPKKEMYIVLHQFEYMASYMVQGAINSLCDHDYVRLHGVRMRKDGTDWYIVTMYDGIANRRAMFSRAMNSLKDFKDLLFALLLSLLGGCKTGRVSACTLGVCSNAF